MIMDCVKKMTSKFLFLVLIVALGCSKDAPTPSLIGTWKLTRLVLGGCSDPANDGKTPCTGSCNAVFTAATFTYPPVFGDATAYSYKTNAGVLTLSTPSGSDAITYELTIGALTMAFKDQTDGCTYTLYFSKV
jgi:hypothetical protein